MRLEVKCLTPTDRNAMMNAFSSAESYIKENLERNKKYKDSATYRMLNANLIELEDIRSVVKNTPECSILQLSAQLIRELRKKYLQQ